MGKKSRLKRRKYDLLRHEFINLICQQCQLCRGKTNADFCYDSYASDPRKFIQEVLDQLKMVKDALPIVDPKATELITDEEFEYTLEEAFCAVGICGHAGPDIGASCAYKLGCLHALRAQIMGSGKKIISIGTHRGRNKNRQSKNKTRKEKRKYIVHTPKFFCNEGFRKEVDRIIGNNAGQQNKGEGSSQCTTTGVGGEVKDS